MLNVPAVPRGRTGWAIGALLLAILGVSSAAPFVRLGQGIPAIGIDDVRSTALYLLTWIPLLLVCAWLWTRAVPHTVQWVLQVFLLFSVPVSHTVLFSAVDAAFSPGPFSMPRAALEVLTLVGMLQYLVVMAVGFAYVSGRESDRARATSARLELEHSRLESLLTQARLSALMSQLQPHFLFNTLNSISVLCTSDPPAAQKMIRQLGGLLRAIMSAGDEQTVVFSQEVELLEKYVEIQQLRFGTRLTVGFAIDAAAACCSVPTLILQPLVENAIEHAVSRRESGSVIRISGVSRNGRLHIQVSDDGASEGSPGTITSQSSGGHGIGLANTRQRLEQMYGANHEFLVSYHQDGGCTVDVMFPADPVARSNQ